MNKNIMLFALIMPLFTFADDFSGCGITSVVIDAASNDVLVNLDCNINDAPQCASVKNRFTFDKSTAKGKNFISLVMNAYNSKKTISGSINKNCSLKQKSTIFLDYLTFDD